jgi:two-component system OmpR family response regulator
VTVRSVDTLVKRVRRKIEADPSNPQIILTVWGAGYKVADV